ncbi:hypothetical protein C6V83_14850 [Gordonia iterans]|uniref:Uncharacterized protein n=1 Tax=Gordonia iterans TaxID=1004901 RepID=A0A2S0KI22_9ACTN|nr:hypothetical protein [Gordonia iterans]AVM01329.1 hypothetical protein C6V83_14850 [Gordonia iterans]
MAQNDPFGPGDDDFDRFAREVGEGLKDMVGKFLAGQGGQAAWSRITDAAARPRRTEPAAHAAPGSEPAGGVWAVLTVDDDGPRVEQVFPTEIEALRANQHNTEPGRRVRFLPYGIAVDALDGEHTPESM